MYYILWYCFLVVIITKLFFLLTSGVCKCQKCLVGKVAIVTGASQGIGYNTALNLASRGCKVIIADIASPEDAKHKIIKETNNPNIIAKYVDYSSFESVRTFAKYINENVPKIDILINNAGCYEHEITTTKDGNYTMMQVNYFSHFLITHLLLDLMKKSKTRVVFLSSCVCLLHKINSQEDLFTVPKINDYLKGIVMYSNTKILMAIMAQFMANKLRIFGITCCSVNPGFANTGILVNWRNSVSHRDWILSVSLTVYKIIIAAFAKSPKVAAWPVLHCAISDKVEEESGSHYWDCIKFPLPLIAYNKRLCLELWEESERIVKLKNEEKILEINK